MALVAGDCWSAFSLRRASSSSSLGQNLARFQEPLHLAYRTQILRLTLFYSI